MGIDPGTNFMGYAILKTTGKNCKPELVVSGVVDMKKMTDPYLKLQRVFQRTLQVIDSYHPDELAIEAQFYGKNIQSSDGHKVSPSRLPFNGISRSLSTHPKK